MNKNLFSGLLIVLLCSRLYGQSPVTLSKTNTPLLPGTVHYKWAGVKGISDPKTGRNIVWNYSSLIGDSSASENYVSKIITPFTKSKTAIIDTEKNEFLLSNHFVPEYNFYDEDASGLYYAGSFVSAKLISTASFFNNPNDNIIIPNQNDSVRINLINFPDSIGESHRQKAVKTFQFSWTVQSANLDTAPALKKTYFIRYDTAVGFGTVRIPTPLTKSIAYPVILIRQKTITIDSYFVNGKVPNKYFLLAFGIIQGKKTADCSEYFYRAGRQSPLLVIGFGGDSTFSTPVIAKYNTDSITPEPPSSIEMNEAPLTEFNLFPNPSYGNNITCSFAKPTNGTWKLRIANSMGQVVHDENIDAIGNISIALDMNPLKSGLYFATLTDDNNQVIATGKIDLLK